ncbi:hypothetical protein HYY71_03585 [Candidatus Woesearchaeota archaeon]|nr:hypothetical protein [Candidatus Woesearchaeota archaeon]
MFIPKKYGQSRIDRCPFCQKQATIMNRQNVPVCASHKGEVLDNDVKTITVRSDDPRYFD